MKNVLSEQLKPIALTWNHFTENRLEPPSVFQFLSGQCNRVYVRFERVPIDEVMSEIDNLNVGGRLTEASGMMKWLHSRFVLKDELFESFYKKPEGMYSKLHA